MIAFGPTRYLSVSAAALAASLLAVLSSAPAYAGNIAECEVVIMEFVQDDNGSEGGLTVSSFRPANDFMTALYDPEIDTVRDVDGQPIRAVLCKRNNIVPDDTDFEIVATGIPFALSQNFDSNESDSLTVYFADGRFQYKYASAEPLRKDLKALLDEQMDAYSSRDHNLGLEPEIDTKDDVKADLGDEATSDIQTVNTAPDAMASDEDIGDVAITLDDELEAVAKTESELLDETEALQSDPVIDNILDDEPSDTLDELSYDISDGEDGEIITEIVKENQSDVE